MKTFRLLTAYYTFRFESEGEAMKLEKVIEKFDSYMSPKKSITYMRYWFFSYIQAEGQTTDEYVTELKSSAEHCEFVELKTSLIQDKVVIGVYDKKVQKRFLKCWNCHLTPTLQIFLVVEKVKKQLREIKVAAVTNTAKSTIEAINKNSWDDGNKMM